MIGGGKAITEDITTAIIYGGHPQQQPSTKTLYLPSNHVLIHLKNTMINDVIVVGNVPNEYLEPLRTTFKRARKISLYAYEGDFFQQICQICPDLNDLTLERMDKRRFDLGPCRQLNNLWIWNAEYPGNNVSTALSITMLLKYDV